jgi:hypothetical protein
METVKELQMLLVLPPVPVTLHRQQSCCHYLQLDRNLLFPRAAALAPTTVRTTKNLASDTRFLELTPGRTKFRILRRSFMAKRLPLRQEKKETDKTDKKRKDLGQ